MHQISIYLQLKHGIHTTHANEILLILYSFYDSCYYHLYVLKLHLFLENMRYQFILLN